MRLENMLNEEIVNFSRRVEKENEKLQDRARVEKEMEEKNRIKLKKENDLIHLFYSRLF